MDIPQLYALHAGDDLDTWRKLKKRKVIHKILGLGRIESVYRNEYGVIKIVFKFESQSKSNPFTLEIFENGNITEIKFGWFGWFIERYLLKNEGKYLCIEKENDRLKEEKEKAIKEAITRIDDDWERKEEERIKKVVENGVTVVTHCYYCKRVITDNMKKCRICGWYKCDYCNSCGCRYMK